jgi:hypothetical protein
MEKRKKKKKKKSLWGRRVSLGLETPALLAVQQVAAGRCN